MAPFVILLVLVLEAVANDPAGSETCLLHKSATFMSEAAEDSTETDSEEARLSNPAPHCVWTGEVGAVSQGGRHFFFPPQSGFPLVAESDKVPIIQYRSGNPIWSGKADISFLSDSDAPCEGCSAEGYRVSKVPAAGDFVVGDTFCVVLVEFNVLSAAPKGSNPAGKYFGFDSGDYDLPTCAYLAIQMRAGFSSTRRRANTNTVADTLDLVRAGGLKLFERAPADLGCEDCTKHGRREPASSASGGDWETGDYVCLPDVEFEVVSAQSHSGKGSGYYFFIDLRGYEIPNGRYPVMQYRVMNGVNTRIYGDYIKVFNGDGGRACAGCDAHGRRDQGAQTGQFREGDILRMCSSLFASV